MRDFVRGSWKIGAAFAAGAFLLSLLIGLITGNPFGVVILRALLLAVIFAGLGAGLRFVISTWLPELSAGSPTERPIPAEDTRGSKVDIVLGDDEARPVREGGEGVEGASIDTLPESGEPGPEDESAARAEAAALGVLAKELSGDSAGEADAPFAEDTPLVQDLEVDQGDEPAELPGAPEVLDAGSSGGLDSLPDIALQDDLVLPQYAKSGKTKRPPTASSGVSPSDAVREKLGRQDPATLARGLRTFLKKDEKG